MALFRSRKKEAPVDKASLQDRGILVFENTSEVIRAESLLKKEGWPIKVKGPPPEIRTGCDLVIEFPLIQGLDIIRALDEEGLKPLEAVPVTGPLLQPVDLFQITDFGPYLMVRAANMKLTVDKETGRIVNVSGGGCPDVPYLAKLMVGPGSVPGAPAPGDGPHPVRLRLGPGL